MLYDSLFNFALLTTKLNYDSLLIRLYNPGFVSITNRLKISLWWWDYNQVKPSDLSRPLWWKFTNQLRNWFKDIPFFWLRRANQHSAVYVNLWICSLSSSRVLSLLWIPTLSAPTIWPSLIFHVDFCIDFFLSITINMLAFHIF